ncbi:DegT/DnrJ/EryC1/StrS family aminotransferase [Cerasicoccus arenae]|uniref:Pleiotropic regulatory protein n=1 Tax=Cerasicoccus arenae TaxID=424488 RepID=A0A8J3DDK6_9BACT|nr:DegT/DnrJ/EryC1/StrS family aminotransferase [Cerasicoccus arenae]MBK1858054.1 DegT/DnrJ/EryC1/StrS family aminotransferase [Cerasicoccus arenae]GHC06778.1 pleiotropic regulatory protein [Cerasicoccus arenae]
MADIKVPLLDLNEQNHSLAAELTAAFERVLGHGQFILGQEVSAFEEAAAKELGARHAIGVSSGTDALLLALMALDIGPGDEVICPSFSFFASAGTIARLGAKPVFADICPVCFNLDPESVATLITPRTKAIMPVHLFGQAAAMESLLALARDHNLRVIEDAAQAFGAAYRGKALGTLGDFGCFSFFPSKNLGGFGDSGLITTEDDALAHRARILRVHGAEPKYYHSLIGGNFRIDALQAALLAVKLPHHRQYSHARATNAAEYNEKLGALPGVIKERSCELCNTGPVSNQEAPRLILPQALPENTHIWNQYTVRLPAQPGANELPRDALKRWLNERDIGAEIYYPVPFHQQACFAYLDNAPCIESERAAREVLSIPIYPELAVDQRERVIEAITEFLEDAGY